MSGKTFILAHDTARKGCAAYAMTAPLGWMVRFSEPKRKDLQNARFHAMIGDIAKQTTYAGRKWDTEDTKRILIDEFAAEMRAAGSPLHHDSRIIPSEDGLRIIQLNIRSAEFYVKEAAQFIEFLYAWGAARGVIWTEPKAKESD